MKVAFFQRHPLDWQFSVERLFTDIREALPAEVKPSVFVSRYPSKGIARRIYNIVEAALRQSQINHITGDVHFLVYLLPKRRTVLTIHDCEGLHRLHGIRRSLFRMLWYTIPVKRSGLITVISEFTKTELVKCLGYCPEHIRVVPVPLGHGFESAKRVFNSACPRILHLGSAHNKNLDRSITALKGISCHLHIIAKVSQSQREALKENAISYTAESAVSDTDIITAFHNCDIVLFPSTYEGFGLPIIEGQATGRVVVTSDVCSMPEVAGGGACLVDPLNVESIRAGVLRVIQDSVYREELITIGYQNAMKFSPQIVAQKYVEIYEELLDRAKLVQGLDS